MSVYLQILNRHGEVPINLNSHIYRHCGSQKKVFSDQLKKITLDQNNVFVFRKQWNQENAYHDRYNTGFLYLLTTHKIFTCWSCIKSNKFILLVHIWWLSKKIKINKAPTEFQLNYVLDSGHSVIGQYIVVVCWMRMISMLTFCIN